MPRASNVAAPLHLGLFIITSVRSVAATCKTDFEAGLKKQVGAWPPRAAHEAAIAGSPDVSLPLVGSGFNRTLNIDGFCNDILMSSESFDCGDKAAAATGVWTANVAHPKTAPTGSFLRFDGINCPLSGITLRKTLPKTPGAAFEAEIQFQFETCKAAAIGGTMPKSPVESAVVVIGLRKDKVATNILPWMKEVCNVKVVLPDIKAITVKTKTVKEVVGPGTCKAKGTKIPKKTTAAACEGECQFKINEAKAQSKDATKDGCSGFAFISSAPVDEQCIIYTGEITKLDKAEKDAQCTKMKLEKVDYGTTTAAPPAIVALKELTQNLHLREVFAGAPTSMTAAKLEQVQPRASDQYCFPSAWWFHLQDKNGVPASLPVLDTEWDELMLRLPAPVAAPKAVNSEMLVDRVLVKTCQPSFKGWGRTCVMPKLESVCDQKQLINAIVTGILTPIFGWLLVRGIFNALPPRVRQVQNYDFTNDEGDFPRCAIQGIIVMCFAAIIVCALVSAGLSAAVSYSFGAAGCLHGVREMIVIGCAAGVPSCLAMIIGLLYLYHSGSKHASNKESGATAGAWVPPKGHKLMLLEIPEGGGQGVPINPDIMQTGNSAMASYASQGFPSSIVLDQTSQMLSSHQSPGGQ